jgi:hypothetical protein
MSDRAAYRLDKGVATISMDDGKLNVMSSAMLRDLDAAAQLNHHDTPDELWHTNSVLSARVLSERKKIKSYKARGFIAQWP